MAQAKKIAKAAVPPAKKKRGRPSSYSREMGAIICAHVSSGGTINSFCAQKEPGRPPSITVYRWLADPGNEIFRADYARARESRADARADRIDGYVADMIAGKIDPQVARVAIDAEKWQAGKEQPKRYGDIMAVEATITGDVRVTIGGDA